MRFSSPLFFACLVTLLGHSTSTSAAPILASALPLDRLPNRQLPLARPSPPPVLRFPSDDTSVEIVEPVKEVVVEESIFADFAPAAESTSTEHSSTVNSASTTFRITPKESDSSRKVKTKRSSLPKRRGKKGKHGRLSNKAKRALLETRIATSSTASGSATTPTFAPAASSSSTPADASAPTPSSTLHAPTPLAPSATPSQIDVDTQHSADVTESSRASRTWVPYAAMAQETFGAYE